MRRVNVLASTSLFRLPFWPPAPAQAQATGNEGARLIVGDGPSIDNGTIVVDGARSSRRRERRVPAGATRVNLAGKTVMPMIIDTHVHLSPTRERLVSDLKRRAYYGISGARAWEPTTSSSCPCGTRLSPAPRSSSAPAAASPCPSPADRGALLDTVRGGGAEGGAGACGAARSISSRSGSTTATASTRS